LNNPLNSLINEALTDTLINALTIMTNTHSSLNQDSLFSIIEQRINQHFSPTYCHLQDDSHEHAGHTGSIGGGKHFSISMQSATFANTTAVKRHQMVYAVLQDLLDSQYAIHNPVQGYIHALKLDLRVS
jgi:BolA protein